MTRFAPLALLLPALACTGGPTGVEGSLALSVLDGSPEGVAMLDFLNAGDTDFAVLDDDVPLNRRTAENLIAWRDGADNVRYTGDDRAFETVAQVDDVAWVGPAALDALVAFLVAEDLVPTGGDLLGVFDDVAFTVDEADAALALVNDATFAVLDDDVPLNRRAAENIVANRPLATLAFLEAVPQVGPAAMLRIRNFGWTPVEEEPVEEEPVEEEPVEEEPIEDSGPPSPLGGDCNEDVDCAEGLACLGWTLWPTGWCVEQDDVGTFDGAGGAIPDGDSAGWTSTVEVVGLASVPIDIIVTIDLDHPAPGSLTYTLIDPNEQTATLSAPDPATGITDILWRNITSDDEIHGTWSLVVTDPSTGDAGSVVSWSLYLTSTYD